MIRFGDSKVTSTEFMDRSTRRFVVFLSHGAFTGIIPEEYFSSRCAMCSRGIPMFGQRIEARILLTVSALIAGCNSENTNRSATTEIASSPEETAFEFDEQEGVVRLDSRSVPGQRRRFDLPLGSIELETLNADDGSLTFRYTPEVEGGYSTYECKVPIADKPIEFHVNQTDGTPGGTSFDIETCCELIREGNLLDEEIPSKSQ